jgi:hypothetical protein
VRVLYGRQLKSAVGDSKELKKIVKLTVHVANNDKRCFQLQTSLFAAQHIFDATQERRSCTPTDTSFSTKMKTEPLHIDLIAFYTFGK